MRSLPLYREANLPAPSLIRPKPAPGAVLPAAILSLHSHNDRSFLDDVIQHHISGALRAAKIDNDLVVAFLPPNDDAAWSALVNTLRAYPTILYERLWDPAIVENLARELPETTLVRLIGEHDLSRAPAHHVCPADPNAVVTLLHGLTFQSDFKGELPTYAPNVHPVYVTPAARPKAPSFPITGNVGCPYQTDARTNPIYADVDMPANMGRGCGFCTTGNHYEYKPKDEALSWTLLQLRYLRTHAPELQTLVLRDQNPFYYLTEFIETAEKENLGPFTLLIESRADWWLQNSGRFVRALEAAKRSAIKLAPFLVGIENFSQTELDRFNKGATSETLVKFLGALHRWHAEYAPAMDLSHAAFGFIMFTPWTTIEDLKTNLECIRQTGMDRFRGHLLLSRVRLYPDTALYWLAKRDGLLVDDYARPEDDASTRYGYLPAKPFRFREAKVAKIAELATEYIAQYGGRDERRLLEVLLALVDKAADVQLVSTLDVRRAMDGHRNAQQDSGQTAPTLFRDPPDVKHEAGERKRQIAQILVNAPTLPIQLPVFGLSLLDVDADKRGVDLIFGIHDPVARLRLEWDKTTNSARIDLVPMAQETKRFARVFDLLISRLLKSTTSERFSRAMVSAKELARLPVDVPLGFFRQLVAGLDEPQGLVRTGFLCNQDCGMCWQGRDWGRHGAKQILLWIEDLRRAGARSLIISGGEPTLDPDLTNYVEYARRLGFSDVTLETNAIQAAKPGQAERLARAGVTHAFVSLHSSDPAISDAITRAPGTHERTVRGIHALLEAQIPVVLNAVMTAEGIEHLPSLPDFIHETFGNHPLLSSLMISQPTEPFDRTILPMVVPDPARVRKSLRATIERAFDVGLAIRGLDGPCGPPLCAFGGDKRLVSGKPITSGVDFRRHVPACDQCAARPACFGVRHVEVELFGEECVEPIGDWTT
ncbi:MAG TPA: radical SAM protein [Polyangium sp.]|nr:radical SAM protein [Polyangium sp.]